MSAPKPVVNAWDRLSEKEKVEIFRKLSSYQRSYFDILIRKTKILSKFRTESIVNRKIPPNLRSGLDQVFFELNEGQFAKSTLKRFFLNLNRSFHEDCCRLVNLTMLDTKTAATVIKQIRKRKPDSAMLRLYLAAAKWVGNEWFKDLVRTSDSDNDESPEDSYENELYKGLPADSIDEYRVKLNMLIEKLDVIEQKSFELSRMNKGLQAALAISPESFHDAVEDISLCGDAFRSDLKTLCTSLNQDIPQWTDSDELKEILTALDHHIGSLKHETRRRAYILLAETLENSRIEHRRKKTRDNWSKLKEKMWR